MIIPVTITKNKIMLKIGLAKLWRVRTETRLKGIMFVILGYLSINPVAVIKRIENEIKTTRSR